LRVIAVDGVARQGTWEALGNGQWAVWYPHASGTATTGGGGTTTPTPGRVYHRASTKGHIAGGMAVWSIPRGRHITAQYITYDTGLSTAPHHHRLTVRNLALSARLLAGAHNIVIHYTYYL